MSNFFKDNEDLLFQFENLHLEDVIRSRENDFAEAKSAEGRTYAPLDVEDAMDNYRRVLELVGDIAGEFVAPRAPEVDREGAHFENGRVTYAKGTAEALERLSQAGLMGMTLPRAYGGLNFPTTIYMMAIEIISRADAALMNIFGLQDIAETIHRFADAEIQREYLPKFCKGEVTGAMALTEPDAGSDLQAVKTRAYQDEAGNWYLSGVKRFITNGSGDVLLVLARSEEGTEDARGLSLFVCNRDGVQVRRIENKLGIHGSPTCEIQFNDTPCKLIGERKRGLITYVMSLMNGARLGVAAQALGIAQAAYVEAFKYAHEREQFGKAICHFPAVAEMLINMKVNIEASRSLLYATAKAVDRRDELERQLNRAKELGQPFKELNDKLKQATRVTAFLTPYTKYMITELANQICYDAIQVHGGTGFMQEFNVERHYRDVRITTIYEGTSQLQIVAATGGATTGVLDSLLDEYEQEAYTGELQLLHQQLIEIRQRYKECRDYLARKNDPAYQELRSRNLVELYGSLYVGYLILNEAKVSEKKLLVAKKYISEIYAKALMHAEHILHGYDTMLMYRFVTAV
ncbi:MAG: acyl-CoA dehydrogenase family protein [Bacteroidota bacterium]